MSDKQMIRNVASLFEVAPGAWLGIRRHGRLLLCIPPTRMGALQALALYQPQRFIARLTIKALRMAALLGLHRWILPKIRCHGGSIPSGSALAEAIPLSVGMLLGSAEHKVRRAIVSYQTSNGWEVAKIAFGADGWNVIQGEACALSSLPDQTAGAPRLLGMHRGENLSLIRMPYFQGAVLKPGDSSDAIAMLASWISSAPAIPITDFPEWTFIKAAITGYPSAFPLLAKLSKLTLKPAVRHGDFARWNLLRTSDGKLIALDWEWGQAMGMPGLDLVHFFAQDARLVERLPPMEVVKATLRALEIPACSRYLENSGWSDNHALAIVASIAFTVGSHQQANEKVLRAAVKWMKL